MKFNKALLFMIVFLAIGSSIILNEGKVSNCKTRNSIEMLSYEFVGYERDFWKFKFNDGIFSGIEQITSIMFSLLGLCALVDVIGSKKENSEIDIKDKKQI